MDSIKPDLLDKNYDTAVLKVAMIIERIFKSQQNSFKETENKRSSQIFYILLYTLVLWALIYFYRNHKKEKAEYNEYKRKFIVIE